MKRVSPVILCGGSGTRLWPLSRSGFPKQFLVLSGVQSLFQQAHIRLNDLANTDVEILETIVVTNEEHRFLVLDQVREVGLKPVAIILEPEARNTAPALTLAALQVCEQHGDSVLIVTPSDQVIKNEEAYGQALNKAIDAAQSDCIVVMGVVPDKPETGYGYIKRSGDQGLNGEFIVERFIEKPSAELAMAYLLSGQYCWNSGMLVVKASVWLQALRKFRPDIVLSVERAWNGRRLDGAFIRPDKDAFASVPTDSIDYAVMEKCPGSSIPICMVPLEAGWSDLGAWDAVWEAGAKDARGNVVHGDTLIAETSNTIVHATNRLVGVVGVENLVIVETADVVLVTDRNNSQQVKQLVRKLEESKRSELSLHRKVHRPWGWYDNIDESDRFKVKRIMVKPGASLSLQKHQHRAEHWIVVKGTATVTCGERVSGLSENQSIYIPLGEKHRLENRGADNLEIIEVQTGSYLGEDDIVRYEDIYGRVSMI
jgi:mannose-1-phosphate guanylyltransferase / mannose-6-phosphate isomerase